MSDTMQPQSPKPMKANTKLTIGLVGLAVALGAYMFFVESKKDAPLDTKDVQVWSFTENQAKEITTLEVVSEGKTATYNRTGDVWKLKEMPTREVEKSGFDIAFGYLRGFVAMRKVENPGDLKGYGLDAAKTSIKWTGGGQNLVLYVGEKTPTGDAYFVKGEAPYAGVFTVAAFKVDAWKGLATSPPLTALPSPTPAASGAAAPAIMPGATAPVAPGGEAHGAEHEHGASH